MLAHIHPFHNQFADGLVPASRSDGFPALCPASSWYRQAPRAPLLDRGVTAVETVSSTDSEGITPPSSLIRTHATVQNPPADFGLTSCGGSLQVAASPCWVMDLPDVISADLYQDAWACVPAAHVVHIPVTSHVTSAFATPSQVARRTQFVRFKQLLADPHFGTVTIRYRFRPPGLLATLTAPTLAVARRAAVALTSEQNPLRYRSGHRTC